MKAIIVYSIIVIFGGWLLKLLHIPSNIGFLLLQILDYLPFLFLPIFFKVKKDSLILPSNIIFWLIIVSFLILSFFSTLFHNGSITSTIAHFGAIFRYTPLALFISRKQNTTDYSGILYKSFRCISIVLIFIGYLEIIGGETIKSIFIPLTQSYNSATIIGLEDISGIFPNTVDYAYFLLLSYVIISNHNDTHHPFILFTIYLIPIFFSGSKAALIIFLICSFYQIENFRLIKYTFILTICVCSGILIYQFWDLFYWTVFIDAKSSRLGYLMYTLPSFIEDFSIDTLIGVSPDQIIVYNKINSYPNAPLMTWDVDSMTSFEDEFYVALIVYYGIIGFGLLSVLFGGMYHALCKYKFINKQFNYKILIKSLFTIILVGPLFNQTIIIKPFAIYFWIWIGFLTSNSLVCIINRDTK